MHIPASSSSHAETLLTRLSGPNSLQNNAKRLETRNHNSVPFGNQRSHNAKMSTLALSKRELITYVATDQTPYTGALNPRQLGAHIDHTRMDPVRVESQLSKLPIEERFKATQFTRGLASTSQDTPGHFELRTDRVSAQELRTDACGGTRTIVGSYKAYHKHEFRADNPLRIGTERHNGRFGRRHYDTVVGERTLVNAGMISEVENRPSEWIANNRNATSSLMNFLENPTENTRLKDASEREGTLKKKSFYAPIMEHNPNATRMPEKNKYSCSAPYEMLIDRLAVQFDDKRGALMG